MDPKDRSGLFPGFGNQAFALFFLCEFEAFTQYDRQKGHQFPENLDFDIADALYIRELL